MRFDRPVRIAVTASALAALVIGGVAGIRPVAQQAHATGIQTRSAEAFRRARTFRAELVERELVAPGEYRTVNYRLAVAGAGRYRVDLIEQGEHGERVESTTLVSQGTVYTLGPDGSGGQRMHVVKNVPPELGSVLDNALGQNVRTFVETEGARSMGRERVRGRNAQKIALDAGHFMWVNAETSLPVRERYVSGNTVTREVELVDFDSERPVPANLFDPARLRSTSVYAEDLGFATAGPSSAPTETLGFAPLRMEPPAGWTLTTSGSTDPDESAEGAPRGSVWIERYESERGCILITQDDAGPATDPVNAANLSSPGAPSTVEIAGRRAIAYEDPMTSLVVFVSDGVLVSIEGSVSLGDLIRFAEGVVR